SPRNSSRNAASQSRSGRWGFRCDSRNWSSRTLCDCDRGSLRRILVIEAHVETSDDNLGLPVRQPPAHHSAQSSSQRVIGVFGYGAPRSILIVGKSCAAAFLA